MNNVINIDNTNFEKEVVNSDVPVLVDFTAPWCGPCKALNPILDELAEDMVGKAKVVKIDVDDNLELAKRFNVRGIPKLITYFNGKLQDDVSSMRTKAPLADALTALAEGVSLEQVMMNNIDDDNVRADYFKTASLDDIKALIQNQPELASKETWGMNPASLAASLQRNDLFDFFKNDCEPHFLDYIGLGRVDEVKEFLSQSPELAVNSGEKSMSPLCVAIKYDQLDMVKLLVENGAKPEEEHPKRGKLNALMSLMNVHEKPNLALITYLVENGLSANASCDGVPYLHLAVEFNAPDIANFLIAQGADINVKVKPFPKSEKPVSALEYAQANHEDPAEQRDFSEMVEVLLKYN